MSPEFFVSQFASITPLSRLRSDVELSFDKFDSESFLVITRELFPRSIADWEIRQRFLSICTQFLYRDLRTFDAMVHIVRVAISDVEVYGSNGFNAITAMSLVASKLDGEQLEVVRRLCDDCANIEMLTGNAEKCRNEL